MRSTCLKTGELLPDSSKIQATRNVERIEKGLASHGQSPIMLGKISSRNRRRPGQSALDSMTCKTLPGLNRIRTFASSIGCRPLRGPDAGNPAFRRQSRVDLGVFSSRVIGRHQKPSILIQKLERKLFGHHSELKRVVQHLSLIPLFPSRLHKSWKSWRITVGSGCDNNSKRDQWLMLEAHAALRHARLAVRLVSSPVT